MPDEQKPTPATARRTRTWPREPTELVELTHDRRAFALAMGSIVVALVVGIAVVLWVTGGHGEVAPAPTDRTDAPTAAATASAAQVLSVGIRDPQDGAAFPVGARIPVLVAASSGQSPIAEVTLSLDGAVVGRRRIAPYGFSVDGLTLGVHRLGARAETDAGDGITAADVLLHIVPPPSRPPVVKLAAGTAMAPAGMPWIVPVSVRPGDVDLARVQLSEDGVVLAEATRDPWLLSWTPDRPGRRSLAITAIDADGRQDAAPLALLAYGDSGRILIGRRPAETPPVGDAIDWIAIAGNGALKRPAAPVLGWEPLGAAKAHGDDALPALVGQRTALEWTVAGQGLRITAPTGPGQRQLALLLRGHGALALEFDDASAAPLRDESIGDGTWQLVTVDFHAGTPGAHLVLAWTALAGPVRVGGAVLRER
jgi:hypothetical protein